MKVEYLLDGSPDCPLLRLFDFTETEACQLKNVCNSLAMRQTQEVVFTDLPDVAAVNDCRLVLRVSSLSQGVVQIGQSANFVCLLSQEDWEKLADLTDPFCLKAKSGSYQWLDETSHISLLLSSDGHW